MKAQRLFVGLGSHHGIDRLGWLVADAILKRQLAEWDVRIARTPLDLLNWLHDYAEVHVGDVCQIEHREDESAAVSCTGSRAPVERAASDPVVVVHRIPWPVKGWQGRRTAGSHDMSLLAVLELADRLGIATCAITIWGLEIRHVAQHAGVNCEVADDEAALQLWATQTAAQIITQIQALTHAQASTGKTTICYD